MNLIDSIILYEDGELGEIETIELFAELIRTGGAWSLQGHYGRTASAFIDAGYISKDGRVLISVTQDEVDEYYAS